MTAWVNEPAPPFPNAATARLTLLASAVSLVNPIAPNALEQVVV